MFKVPELPRFASPRKPESSAARSEASPSRASRQVPSTARLASPERLMTSIAPMTAAPIPSASRTLFTPRVRQEASTPQRRNLSSDYRTTMLPPRTPLAERGYGPQSAKKASSSSLSGVLVETDGRSVNARTAGGMGSGMKRSATMNDFTPVKHQNRGDKTPVERHMRTPSDSIVRSGSSTLLANDRSRSAAPTSPTRIATSRIRLPGQGLRQVSGQGKADDTDARSRKQATSPEKLLRGPSTRVSLAPKLKSPPRQRSGFRPVAGHQSVPARVVDRSIDTAPGRQTAAGRLPVSRPGSTASTSTSRSSTIPPRTSTSIARPLGSATGSSATRMAPSATSAGRASNGLPRPTSRIAPSAGVPRAGGSTASATSRLVAPTSSKERHGLSTAGRTGSALLGRNAAQTGKQEETVRRALDRFPACK